MAVELVEAQKISLLITVRAVATAVFTDSIFSKEEKIESVKTAVPSSVSDTVKAELKSYSSVP